MARPNHFAHSSSGQRGPVAFRGIDGRQLAQQYALSRELGSHQQPGEWLYPDEWKGHRRTVALRTAQDASFADDRARKGLLRRIALWLSRIGSN